MKSGDSLHSIKLGTKNPSERLIYFLVKSFFKDSALSFLDFHIFFTLHSCMYYLLLDYSNNYNEPHIFNVFIHACIDSTMLNEYLQCARTTLGAMGVIGVKSSVVSTPSGLYKLVDKKSFIT